MREKIRILIVRVFAIGIIILITTLNVEGKPFFEVNGDFSVSTNDAIYMLDGALATDTNASVQNYKAMDLSGLGFGFLFGYEFVPNLSVTLGFNYKSYSSSDFSIENDFGTSVGTLNLNFLTKSITFDLGLRTRVAIFGGYIFTAGGLLLSLPTDYLMITEYSGVEFSSTNQDLSKGEGVISFNSGIGLFGEVGYQFLISSSLYVNLSVKTSIFALNNIGKTTVNKFFDTAGSLKSKSTVLYKESFSQDEVTAENLKNVTGPPAETFDIDSPKKVGMNSVSFKLVLGYRF